MSDGLLACPACLGALSRPREDGLRCDGCGREYGAPRGLPLLLLRDEHWAGTSEEIAGEEELVAELPLAEHIRRNRFESARTWEFLSRQGLPQNPRVLDVGGSSGIGAWLFHRFDAEVVIVDVVPKFLRVAEVFLSDVMPVQTVCAGMEWLPFPDDSFDVVFCRQALHHSYAPPHALREMFRVARPGGSVLVVSEPCLSLGNRVRRALRAKRAAPGNVLEKLRDESFDYMWTDFRREVRGLTDTFTMERAEGSAALVETGKGLVYVPEKQRTLAGRMLNHVLPWGLGYSGDLHIHAVKTREVKRTCPAPDYPPVPPEALTVPSISPAEAEEIRALFPQFFRPPRESIS